VQPWLLQEVRSRGLGHVSLPGRVTEGIENYYRAADVVALPGRGGMVISEAMAYGRPVIAYHADGTEYDLVIDGVTGVLLQRGTADELQDAIKAMARDPDVTERMGDEAVQRLQDYFGTRAIVERISTAVRVAAGLRGSRAREGAGADSGGAG